MSKIIGIGANVYDTLIGLPQYPKEDTKLRAKYLRPSGGGPCATGLVAASKLGGDCGFVGYVSGDDKGSFLIEDFKKYGVHTDLVSVKDGYNAFTSFVMLSEQSASRTIVFDKGNMPPLILSDAAKKEISKAQILLVDGNELSAAVEGAEFARDNGTKVLYDAGGLYDGIEKLLAQTDILIPSEEFALTHTQTDNVRDAAKKLFAMYTPEIVVITCGKEGGIYYDGKVCKTYPAFSVDAVDTNGSGDVFHGAFAFSVTMGYNYYQCCLFSSAVSALKCTKIGSRAGVPTFAETIQFLKERGVDEFEKNMDEKVR